ncbi:MAG: hypothetical protein JW384_03611 [Nitrosomonadaceae bacterium]|nr:hypothetical protein [Nitrosomonadaceae bacterium]
MLPIRCPECEYDMSVKNRRITRSSIGRVYDWTQYHCKRDDIWIELEVPQVEDEK